MSPELRWLRITEEKTETDATASVSVFSFLLTSKIALISLRPDKLPSE